MVIHQDLRILRGRKTLPPIAVAVTDAMLGALKGQLDKAVSERASSSSSLEPLRGDGGKEEGPPPISSGSGRRDADVASKWATKDVSLIFDNLSVSGAS